MLKLDYNPLKKEWDERMKSLTDEQREKIDAPIGKENLLVLKKSRKEIKDGDVFVLSPKEGLYFYGKVIMASIKHQNDGWMNGCHVIFLFKCKSKTKDLKNFKPDYHNLLLSGPEIVEGGYWRRGYFENIGNIPLTEEEKNLDYGFFGMEVLSRWGTFKNADGTFLDHHPTFCSAYGILVYAGIYMLIRTESIIDPSLLE